MKGISPRIHRIAKATPIFIVAGAIALFSVMYSIDLARPQAPSGWLESVLEADPGTARYTLTSIASTLGTLVAITITLVLIVVELTASRYTPKLIDLFVEAKVNLLLLGVFIFTIIYCFYVAHTIKPEFAPRTGILVCLVLMTVCLVSLIPYLFFVFDFLEPNNIISKIQSRALSCLTQGVRGGSAGRKLKLRFSQSLEQITDIAKGSLRINDSNVALSSVWALRDVSANYWEDKSQRPPDWFEVEKDIFLGPSAEYLRRIEQEQNWVEVKVLRELQTIFSSALEGSPEVATAVAVSTRHIGEQALGSGDEAVVELVVKYFNTFLREAINAEQKRIIYNLLDEYRSLTEQFVVPWPELTVRISHHLSYYARVAEAQGLRFIAETVAYDLKVLNQVAYQLQCRRASDLLEVFLSLDEALRSRGYQRPLPGVYKMWLALGAFYLAQGADSLSKQVQEALSRVEPATLTRLGKELLSVTVPEFWEITDRGVNFDYIEPALRPYLRELLNQLQVSG